MISCGMCRDIYVYLGTALTLRDNNIDVTKPKIGEKGVAYKYDDEMHITKCFGKENFKLATAGCISTAPIR